MKSGSRGHNLISVELTAEGVEAVAEAVVRKLVERGLLLDDQTRANIGSLAETETDQAPGVMPLPETGFLRVSEILKFIPISRATWWLWVKEGRAPKGVLFGPKVRAWRAEDIRDLMTRLGNRAR